MSQKSSKNLSTLSKHMTNDTKLQLDQNTITQCLIIPVLAAANENPVNGEMYVDATTNHLFIYLFIKIIHGYNLFKIKKKQKINILSYI